MNPSTKTLCFSLLLLISPLYTCALSWSKSHALVEDAATLQYETRYDDDVAMIARNAESLQLYSRQPDCFRRAAGLIRAQCGELDVNEDERVRAAISMTLCELATAKNHQPPMECAAYATDSRSDEMVPPPQSHRICVEALSRSAQYWSSYSGYLREVSQLCYAFRRWNDIDTARDIYRNATLEKLTFLRILNEREKRMQERHESTDSLMQDMSGTLGMFRSFAADATVLQEELMRKISAGLSENINELKLAIFGLHQRNEEDQIASVSRVDAAIQAAIEHHSTSLIALAPTFERSLQTHIDRVLQYMLEQYQGISTVADVAHASLTTVGRELDSVERTIRQLVSTAEQANGHAKKNAEQAQEANILQLETTGHAVKLAAIVTDLTTLAHAELQNISDTAYAVQERMRLSGHRLVDGQWSQWTKACAMYILEIVLRVNPERLECLSHSPMFRIISMLTHLCWWLLQSGFSSLMSALLLFVSVKQWLPAPFDRRSALNGTSDVKQTPAKLDTCSSSTRALTAADHYHCRPGYADFLAPAPPRRHRSRISRIPDRLCTPSADGLALS